MPEISEYAKTLEELAAETLVGKQWQDLTPVEHALAKRLEAGNYICREGESQIIWSGDPQAETRIAFSQSAMIYEADEYSWLLMQESAEIERIHKLGELVGFIRHLFKR